MMVSTDDFYFHNTHTAHAPADFSRWAPNVAQNSVMNDAPETKAMMLMKISIGILSKP